MEYRPLGRTGLAVSVLSQGGAAIGQQYGPVSIAEAADCVHTAIDAGINLIDTSAYYGQGRSEEILGEVLAGGWREKVLICTKAGRHTRDRFDFTPAGMRACLEGSLRRLRVDHVDILLAHDIEFATDYEPVFAETAAVLHQLKRAGKARFVRHVVLPTRPPAAGDRAVRPGRGHQLRPLHPAKHPAAVRTVAGGRGAGGRGVEREPAVARVAHQPGAAAVAPGPAGDQGPLLRGRLGRTVPQPRGRHRRPRHAVLLRRARPHPEHHHRDREKGELAANLQTVGVAPDPGSLLADVLKVLEPVRDRTWPSGNWKG